MKIEIRKATNLDADALKKIARKTIDANYRSFLGDEAVDLFIGSGASDQYINENIDDGWVILSEGSLIGLCVMKMNLIDLLMIKHDYHRQGYGTTLLKHCEQQLFRRFIEIKLESFEGNWKAHGFYRKNGWAELETNFDETSGISKITFVKKLAERSSER